MDFTYLGCPWLEFSMLLLGILVRVLSWMALGKLIYFEGCTAKSGFLLVVAISICLHCKIPFPIKYVLDFSPDL